MVEAMSLLSSPQQARHLKKHLRKVARTQDTLSLTERWYRSALTHRLRNIESDTVILQDCAGTLRFGSGSSEGMTGNVHVLDPRFYRQVVWGGGLGAAEAFIRGYWESPDLTVVMRVLARNAQVLSGLERGAVRLWKPLRRYGHWLRHNTVRGSQQNISAHYDLSDKFFATILDSTMSYSAGIFTHPTATLEEASYAKFERLCRLLELSSADHLLEIGTGWGGLALYAAREYGCRVTTTTISLAQYEFSANKVAESGLQNRVQVLKQDYRDLTGQFDKIVSVEMIEAVGHEYLGTYFAKCNSLLRPGGRFALQTITIPEEREQNYLRSVDFIQQYIFPGGCLPSVSSLLNAVVVQTDLELAKLDEFGDHYAETIAQWHDQFTANLERVRRLGMTERFLRTWHYYLSYCEAGFREKMTGLKQILLIKPPV